MAEMASFFQNPFIIVVLTALAVVLLLVGFVAAKILHNQRLADRSVTKIVDSLAQIGDSVIRLHLSLETVGERLRDIEKKTGGLAEGFDQSRQELADLAQNFSGDKQMSRAIELARNGAAANELTLATGIGQDEAEAIVKFHGTAKS
jgi:DNA uptake protein ComE-like DNA-binding protein